MKFIEILPELEEGGVERHVLWLSNGLARRGHEVLVVSAGSNTRSSSTQSWHLPVHYKNPLTVLYSAVRIASAARREGYDLIHAHSRVPAWVALLASKMAGVPFVVTLHVRFGNRSPIVYKPYRLASRVICGANRLSAMGELVGDRTVVIGNGLPGVRNEGNPLLEVCLRRTFRTTGKTWLPGALSRLKVTTGRLDMVEAALRKNLSPFVRRKA